MKDKKIKEILAKVKSFPTMPGAGAKMLALLHGLFIGLVLQKKLRKHKKNFGFIYMKLLKTSIICQM